MLKYSQPRCSYRIALELGKYGITVNAYAPGAIDTTFRKSDFGGRVAVSFIFGQSEDSMNITLRSLARRGVHSMKQCVR